MQYVHFCLEANESIISGAHGAEQSSLLHVAGNTGNIDLTKVSCYLWFVVCVRGWMQMGARAHVCTCVFVG